MPGLTMTALEQAFAESRGVNLQIGPDSTALRDLGLALGHKAQAGNLTERDASVLAGVLEAITEESHMAGSASRNLESLLHQAQEAPDVEIKTWLDLTDRTHQADLAKAIMALANHGGGFVLFGLAPDADGRYSPVQPAPAGLAQYNHDVVNDIVKAYADPPFHCRVEMVKHRAGSVHPVVLVPGGHRVPIRARRSGPDERHVKMNTYYVRRAGPASEAPQTAQEWDGLLRRCIANNRTELFDLFRVILTGEGASASEQDGALAGLKAWSEESVARWRERIQEVPPQHPARCDFGYWTASYTIEGIRETIGAPKLLDALRESKPGLTGWSTWWVPTREEIRPRVRQQGVVECWMGKGGDGAQSDPGSADFWRASPRGRMFLLRGFQEDGGIPNSPPGKYFDLTLPIWRMGECLVHAQNMAKALGMPDAEVTFQAEWTGLAQRRLAVLAERDYEPGPIDDRVCEENSVLRHLVVQADLISSSLPEHVYNLLRPLYELFNFFDLPRRLVNEQLGRLLSRRHLG